MAGHDGEGGLRAAARRDSDFVGIDVDAMAHLIAQMKTASDTILGWLRANAGLPPSVSRAGIHQAKGVERWTEAQARMLTNRRNYALRHLGKGNTEFPKTHPGSLGRTRRDRHTRAGAAHDLGHFPDGPAGTRAGTADAATVAKAVAAHRPIPAGTWRRLRANADDPDYTAALYRRLGPDGTARLIGAALPDDERRAAVEASLGVASHRLPMKDAWLRSLLREAYGKGTEEETVRLLRRAHLSENVDAALRRLLPGADIAAEPQPSEPARLTSTGASWEPPETGTPRPGPATGATWRLPAGDGAPGEEHQ